MNKKYIFPIVMFVFLASSLTGQTYTSFEDEKNAILGETRLRLGPFRFFPRLLIQGLGYDDNVFRYDVDPVSDFTFVSSLELRTYLLFRDSLILSFTINPEYVYYYEFSYLRGWHREYLASIKWRLLHRFVLSGNYINSTRRQRPTSEFDERVNVTTQGYSGSVFYEMANNVSFGLSAQRDNLKYKSVPESDSITDYARRLNRDETIFSFDFYYPIFEQSQFFIMSEYTEYNFQFPEAQVQDSVSYEISSGIQFPLLGNMRGTLSLGYKKLIPNEQGISGYSGIVGNTSLDYRVSRFGFRILYARDIPFSFYTRDNLYFIDDRIGGGLSFYLSSSIRLDYDILHGRANYPETVLVPDDGEFQRIDKFLSHRAAIVFRLFSNTGLGFNVDFVRRESYVSRNFENTFIGLYLIYDF